MFGLVQAIFFMLIAMAVMSWFVYSLVRIGAMSERKNDNYENEVLP
jgi:hypothetical protein